MCANFIEKMITKLKIIKSYNLKTKKREKLVNCPRGKLPRLGLRLEFELGLGLVLGLGAIFLRGNCPRTGENAGDLIKK